MKILNWNFLFLIEDLKIITLMITKLYQITKTIGESLLGINALGIGGVTISFLAMIERINIKENLTRSSAANHT